MSDVFDRLIRYAKVATPSDPANEAEVPSNPEEHDLARLLAQELQDLGVEDSAANEHAYVIAHVPASAGAEHLPCLGLIAHIDASPDAPAHGVEPRIFHYEGGELVLGEHDGVKVSLTEENTPGLSRLAGKDLLATDGSTLLSADDKAGVAEIMAVVARFAADPSLPHPRLAICFAPDEEIGHGCSLLDLTTFGAEYAYTVDGGELGGVEYECFNAASASITFDGNEIHPGSAKDVMVNALHLLFEFDAMLPAWQRPEHTEGYDGFFHLSSVEGTTRKATAHYIIRDHSPELFEQKKQHMLDVADFMNRRWNEPRVNVHLREQYHNMAEAIAPHMHLIRNAEAAFTACGVQPFTTPVRGGTDGAQLSLRGLPCPNLSTGGYNFHSVREFIPVASLDAMVDMLQELCRLYAEA